MPKWYRLSTAAVLFYFTAATYVVAPHLRFGAAFTVTVLFVVAPAALVCFCFDPVAARAEVAGVAVQADGISVTHAVAVSLFSQAAVGSVHIIVTVETVAHALAVKARNGIRSS